MAELDWKALYFKFISLVACLEHEWTGVNFVVVWKPDPVKILFKILFSQKKSSFLALFFFILENKPP